MNERQKKVMETLGNLKTALEGYVAHLEAHTVAMAQAHVTAAEHHARHADFHRRTAESAAPAHAAAAFASWAIGGAGR